MRVSSRLFREDRPPLSHVSCGPQRANAVAAVLLMIALVPTTVGAQASRIEQISPSSARRGEIVTVSGIGFGALDAVLTVGGIAAPVLRATGNTVVFRVPPTAPFGSVEITTTNPGGRTGQIKLQILEGTLLSGPLTQFAGDAMTDLPPIGVEGSDIQNGVIMTRLAARLTPDATVGQVNAALGEIGAGIVTMSRGTLSLTLAIPRQPTLAAVEALANRVSVLPGIRLAWPAVVVSPKFLPFVDPNRLSIELVTERFLLPSRFPAAWNVAKLAVGIGDDGSLVCTQEKVPVLILDFLRRCAREARNLHSLVPARPFGPISEPVSRGWSTRLSRRVRRDQ